MAVLAELLDELNSNIKNIRFARLCNILNEFGFEFKGGKGSHRIFARSGIEEMINVQDVKGKAKPYQVRQIIKIIERYGLAEE